MQIKNKQKHKATADLDGSKQKGCIVVARWNGSITKKLLESALVALKKSKMLERNIRVIHVAGSVEIPFALHKIALSGKYDFLVALGCIIRGETPHFDYVAKMVTEGVLRVGLDYKIPIGFGVITADNEEQTKARLHLGRGAVIAAIHSAKEIKNLSL